MMKTAIRCMLVALAVFFGMSLGQATEATHTVQRGETLSEIAGKDWKVVCELNKLADCNKIVVGQVLNMTSGSRAHTVSPPVMKFQQASCIKLGAAPFNPAMDVSRTLEGIDLLTTLTPEQKTTAKALVILDQTATEKELVGKQVFEEMLYQSKVTGKVVHIREKPICNPQQGGVPEIMKTYDLGNGVFLALPRRCGNVAVFHRYALPPPRVTIAEPVPSEPAPERVVETEKGCIIDPKLVIGQEHEPKHGGNNANSTYLAGALYCTWRGQSGTHGVGVGVQASMWDGLVNRGAGKFTGHLIGVGPAYEYVADQGWDIEAKLLFIRLDESFKQDDYKSERHFDLVGPALAYNNYERRNRQEKWFPEVQLSGVLGFPLSRHVSHSWQGKSIADTRDLSRFGVYFNAGARAWIYDGDVLQPYVQGGYFLESPSAESVSFRIGVADPNRICGIGVGIDHDLKQGGNANAWGFWCDAVKGIKVIRRNYRLNQVTKETGATFDKNGMLMVPMSRPETIPDS